jgi:phage-related minor tail protein
MNDPFASPSSTTAPAAGLTADLTSLRAEMADTARIGQQLTSSLATGFESLVVKGRGLTDVVRTLGQALSQIALKAAFKPLENALGSGLSGLFSGGLSGGLGGINLGFAHGGILQGGVPVPFAQGGVIASPISFPLAGGQTGIAGERGSEAIMPLARGRDGRLGVVSAGGGGVQVHVNIATQDLDSFQRAESQISAMLARAVSRGQRHL